MAPGLRVLLFGDQTVQTKAAIQSLIQHSKNSELLQTFLVDAEDVIRIKVAQLENSDKKRFDGFLSLVGLAERHDASEFPDDIRATALITIAQLGELILLAEEDSSILSSDRTIVGLCSGALPAAVAAVSKGIADLLKLSIQVVSLAFDMAIETGKRSSQIEGTNACWGYSVVGISAPEQQNILDRFNKEKKLPLHRHAYLSVISDNWSTVSGPPSVLEELFSYPSEMREAHKAKLPFGTAAHASHLPPLDVDKLVHDSGIRDEPIDSPARFLSASTSKAHRATGLRNLLKEVINDITNHPLRFHDTIQAIASVVGRNEHVCLIPVGPLNHTGSVQRTLQSQNIQVSIHQLQTPSPKQRARDGSGDIAILGMSGRFPGSDSIEEFWESLLARKEFHQQVPRDRFDLDAFFDPTGQKKNSTSVPYGNFLKNPGLFDSRLFKVSPREAAQMDPLQRMLLMTTYEALEMAGYSPNGTASTANERIASFWGQSTEDYIDNLVNEGIDVYYVPAAQRAFAPGRLNYHFGWSGPTYSVDSACASSTTAVQLACNALLSRQCDTAVAGGGNVITRPGHYAGLSRASFLSKTGACKSFQEGADGYCRGEGVGVVVLKRVEDAIADNDNILGVIRGVMRNSSPLAASITHPSSEAQQTLYRELLQKTAIDAAEVGFVEMHATATQAGDFAEMTSVTEVFGQNRGADNPLYVGGVKASVGHGEAAAGITSLIKSVMMLQKKTIPGQPPMLGPMNSRYPAIARMNIHVAEVETEFRVARGRGAGARRGNGRRKILLNNFDAAGGNASLLIEEAPPRPAPAAETPKRTAAVVVVSAATAKSFAENKKRLLEHLRAHPEIDVSDLAYTTAARRVHHAYRKAYVSSSVAGVADMLQCDLSCQTRPLSLKKPARVAFAFTGQGKVYMSLATQLYQSSERFRNTLHSYQRTCDTYGFEPFISLVQGTNTATPSATQSQLAIVAVSIALAELWKSWGVQPSLVIGHSLGEYAALCVAGVISVHDALYLVGKRASLLQRLVKANTHCMLSIALGQRETIDVLRSHSRCEIACINGPALTVVSGSISDIEMVEAELRGKSIAATRLDTAYAFHSRQVDPILEELRSHANQVAYNRPKVPVASTLYGNAVEAEGVFGAEYLVKQCREPVNFVGALAACKSASLLDESTFWLECGPHPVCIGLIQKCVNVPHERLLPSLKAGKDDWKTISSAAATLWTEADLVDWHQFYAEYKNSVRILDLPHYAFDLENFWIRNDATAYGGAGSEQMNAPALPSLLTPSVQAVQVENLTSQESTIVFESRMSEPKLLAAMQGHIVDGSAICPATVFTDMASTAARYLFCRKNSEAPLPAFAITDLEITHPLLPNQNGEDPKILINATQRGDESLVVVTFSCQSGMKVQQHGRCTVEFGEPAKWNREWSKSASLVRAARRSLTTDVAARRGHYLSKPIAYQLFSRLVNYSANYQAMEEVYVSEGFTEAVANLRFRQDFKSEGFMCSPFWYDSLVHLAGFMMNCNLTKPDDVLHVSVGFESFHLAQELRSDLTYTTFVHVRDEDGKGNTLCDAYIFLGDEIIGSCSGLMFHKTLRTNFQALTGQSRLQTAPVPKARAAPAAAAETKATALPVPGAAAEDKTDFEGVLRIIAEQTGVDPAEIEDSSMFADLGVDSLMSMTIIEIVQKQTGLALPASFFQMNASVGDAREALCGPSDSATDDCSSSEMSSFESVSGQSGGDDSTAPSSDQETDSEFEDVIAITTCKQDSAKAAPGRDAPGNNDEVSPKETTSAESKDAEQAPIKASPAVEYESKVVHLHGKRDSSLVPVFLIVDGAGSAAAYLQVPAFPRGRPVYALESPYLRDPAAFDSTVEELGKKYLAAVRKVRPNGPYILGGWSAGAVMAYEVSRLLMDANETILGLVLVDMHAPKPLPHAPAITPELLDAIGLTVGIKRGVLNFPAMANRLKHHLLGVCKALVKYTPLPMARGRQPLKTYIIWAELGLSEVEEMDAGGSDGHAPPSGIDEMSKRMFYGEDDPAGGERSGVDQKTGLLGWFIAKRKTSASFSFGANGWDALVGDNIKTFVVNADHFSMMALPHVSTTAKYMHEAVEECAR